MAQICFTCHQQRLAFTKQFNGFETTMGILQTNNVDVSNQPLAFYQPTMGVLTEWHQLQGWSTSGPRTTTAQGFYIQRGEGSEYEKMIQDLPSGYVKIAVENDHRNSGFSH